MRGDNVMKKKLLKTMLCFSLTFATLVSNLGSQTVAMATEKKEMGTEIVVDDANAVENVDVSVLEDYDVEAETEEVEEESEVEDTEDESEVEDDSEVEDVEDDSEADSEAEETEEDAEEPQNNEEPNSSDNGIKNPDKATVTNLRAYVSSSSGKPNVRVSWADSTSRSYKVYRSTASDGEYTSLGITSFKYFYDNYCVLGTTYYYKVEAYTSVGDGEMSAPVSVKFEVEIPSFYIYDGKDKKAVLEFGDRGYFTAFKVYRASKKNGKYKKIATTYSEIYKDKSAKKGKSYYYKIEGVYYDKENNKTYTSAKTNARYYSVGLMDDIDIKYTRNGKSSVKLEWNKIPGASQYLVMMSNEEDYATIDVKADTTKTYATIKGLKTGKTYYVNVMAVKKSKGKFKKIKVGYTDVSLNMHTELKKPLIPTITYKNGVLKNKYTLKWDKVYGVDGYYVERRINYSDEWSRYKTLSKDKTSYTVTLSSKDSYRYIYYRIVAYKGTTEYTTDYVDLELYIKDATNVNVKKKSSTSATISWKKATGVDFYVIYRIDSMGRYSLIGKTNKNTIVDNEGLEPGITYTYMVGSVSEKLGCHSLVDCQFDYEDYLYDKYVGYYNYGKYFKSLKSYRHTLSKTKFDSIKNTAEKTATVTWKKNKVAQKYIIYRASSKNGKYKEIATVNSSNLSYVDTGLKKGKTYYYKIAGYYRNSLGKKITSSKSAAMSVKIKK